MGTPRRRKSVNELARKLSLEDGDVVLIKAGTGMANRDNINQLTKSLGMMGYYKTLVIVVDSLEDINTLNEATMMRYGWYREKEAVADQKPEPQDGQED